MSNNQYKKLFQIDIDNELRVTDCIIYGQRSPLFIKFSSVFDKYHMGLDARKPVFWGLRTTKAQISGFVIPFFGKHHI